ncbi:hypothetical protein [Globicatella sp. PHS-GS-PNBC-21-1553]|uniref:hypothetical protein n=1 Tax=Globicatella sp. PHS-GS-PNBC-21-1553 TaxID=2885764 RepID=UPI00298F0413|nr:hypothetical protein [Globicatella sp. PHS-GS-PNBC-21-1553]WPC07944.1 hypothetical protein LB888_07655 [Globicatella sp. PHS-GS-PNBC-21-1553]
MKQSIISILKYETFVSPGAFFHLKTDWFHTDQEIKTIIIDQDNLYSKLLSIYPKDFVMYLEQDKNGSLYRTNMPLTLCEEEGYYTVEWPND